jgi:putative inorganic carbon (hco3(-)) transporter
MELQESFLVRATRWLAFGSAVAILFSIAASQILLGLALASLLLSGEKLRMPPIWIPLALFIAGTFVAVGFSENPAAGLPQIRKLFVFSQLVVVFSALRDARLVRWLFLTWAGFAGITGARGIVQFVQKVQQAQQAGSNAYEFYVGERITGFMSHWNTFSAQEMFALLMLASLLFFAPGVRRRMWVWILCGAVIAVALLLAETRAVWIGTGVATLYLLWFWKRWTLALAPVAMIAIYFLSPPVIRHRFDSLLQPKNVDSNEFRKVTWRTGSRMIAAHPLLGLGPEIPKIDFDKWVPPEIPRPLPVGSYIHLHNLYLQYAAERGIPVLLCMLWILGKALFDFSRALKGLPPGRNNRRFLLHGGIAIILASLAEGFFEYNLGDSEVLTMFLVVLAASYLAVEKDVIEG